MKKYALGFLVLNLLFACASRQAGPSAEQEQKYLGQAQKSAQLLMSNLQQQLKAAIKAGGTANAIETCSVIAPALASQISQEQNLSIRRVSLKSRNPQDEPDAFEQKVLELWAEQDREQATDQLYETSILTPETVPKTFRYMKAIRIQPACLQCHGENIAPDVSTAISTHYPKDQATAYKLGDLRGAVSVSIQIP